MLEIDRAQRLVRLDGQPLALPDLSYRFLLTLAAAAPAPAAPDALQAAVWGEVQVGPDAIKQRARLLRDALRQAGCVGDPVPAERHRGYRLGLPVHFVDLREIDRPSPPRLRYWWLAVAAVVSLLFAATWIWWPAQTPAGLVLSYTRDQPSLIALSESIAAQFTAIERIEVRQDAGGGDGGRGGGEQVRLDLQREGDGAAQRVRLRLVDGATGRLIASELYSLPAPASLDETDRVAAHFVFRMQDRLAISYPQFVLEEPALSDAAATAYLAALDAAATGHTAGLIIAKGHLEAVIASAPEFAAAHRRLAIILARLSREEAADPELAARALVHARTAARLAPLQPESERALGMALWANGNLDQAWLHLTRAQQRLTFLSRDLAALARERDTASTATATATAIVEPPGLPCVTDQQTQRFGYQRWRSGPWSKCVRIRCQNGASVASNGSFGL
tara:strand:- start:305 stop:1654 length:1350 start_codon:yes stop_codon:yes gene_type:complete